MICLIIQILVTIRNALQPSSLEILSQSLDKTIYVSFHARLEARKS